MFTYLCEVRPYVYIIINKYLFVGSLEQSLQSRILNVAPNCSKFVLVMKRLKRSWGVFMRTMLARGIRKRRLLHHIIMVV